MVSIENEAKKLAATYARWLRNPQEALFGKQGGRGIVMVIYDKVKSAKTKDEIIKALDLSQYPDLDKATYNDLSRFFDELINKISQFDDQNAIKFTIEAFRYFQIALFTKIEDINKGYWA
ncbi:hypothetical protein EWF20_12130 [Sulfolobus sp. S-194]|nr:hypothetical protein EWF20_12130 [Sulfolobus sp. S-194]